MKTKSKSDPAAVELTDQDLRETQGGGLGIITAGTPSSRVKEKAIQDLEAVKDGIRDY